MLAFLDAHTVPRSRYKAFRVSDDCEKIVGLPPRLQVSGVKAAVVQPNCCLSAGCTVLVRLSRVH